MEPQLPRSGAKSDAPTAPPANPPVIRRYPKPPALLPRIILYCLKPEAWPAAARYPSKYTIIPLILAIVLAAVAIGSADAIRMHRSLESLATSLPPVEINSDHVLKFQGDRTEPVRHNFPRFRLVIDPAAKSGIDISQTPGVVMVTDRDIVTGVNRSESRLPLSWWILRVWDTPEAGKTTVVDGPALQRATLKLAFIIGSGSALLQLLRDGLWVALMLFFVAPLITLVASLGEPSVLLPRRATYRMAAAILIPLIFFNGIMDVAGYPISDPFGAEVAWLICSGAAAALGVWTGIMAKRIYGATRKRPTPRDS
jgi:hypothetical protein